MKRLLVLLAAAGLASAAVADEGMWTFDNFPSATVKQKYGVDIDQKWLDRVRTASVRLDGGCSGSLISGDGLILTNHHCIESCVAALSTAEKDHLANGFLAADRGQELRCEDEQISVLMGTENVTDKVANATRGLPDAEVTTARNKQLSTLEEACEAASAKDRKTGPLKCEAVTLYQGGEYWLYKYKRHDDVRLVFVPEKAIASFGGDPDNFQFPRWSLDMGLLRIYDAAGKPVKTPNHLAFNWDGAAEGEAVFVSGHPGATERLLTSEQLNVQRNTFLPFWLARFYELRGRVLQYAKTGPEARRTSEDFLNLIENSIKVRRKQLDALLDDEQMARVRASEAALQKAIDASPELKAIAGTAFADIAKAQQVDRDTLVRRTFIDLGAAFNSDLFVHARNLVRAADERQKPSADRLREFTDAALPKVRQGLAAQGTFTPEMDILRLSFSLERMREWLGPDDPIVRQVLGKESPDQLAERLVKGSTLADPKVRLALFDGGKAAVDASNDPMIAIAKVVDDEARRLRKINEDQVVAPVRKAQAALSRARFATLGTGVYPDATFTLRLSYGAVKGWTELGQPVVPFTQLQRAFDRATGQDPFRLPDSWLKAKPTLDLTRKANFVTTNDIIGGNSGSPMINAKAEIVGLAFDGNIHSIAGSYWFDEKMNRTVGVHPQFIRTALQDVYKAEALLKELGVKR